MNPSSNPPQEREEITAAVVEKEPVEVVETVADMDSPETLADGSSSDTFGDKVSAKKSTGSSIMLWLVLLVMIAIGGVLLVPNPWQGKARDGVALLQSWWQPTAIQPTVVLPASHSVERHVERHVEQAIVLDLPIEPPAPEKISAAEEPSVSPPKVTLPEEPVTPEPITVAVKNDPQLDRQLDALHQQLQRVTSSQQQLAQQQQTIAHAALRQQIAFLTAPAASLQQTVQAWSGVVQLAGLDASAHQRAQAIHVDAKRLLAQRRQWQRQLQAVAKSLHHAMNGQRVTLAEMPLIADWALTHWLDQQFTLVHLPSAEQQQKNRFSRNIQQIAAAMEYDRWPSAEEWRVIRQHIGYWLDPVSAASLPNNFDGMRQQLLLLRQQQSVWIEEVQ